MFKRILVAIDASDYSKQILPTAIEIGRKFQSEVFVLHVAEHDRGRAAAYTTEMPAEATQLVANGVKEVHDAGIAARGAVHDAGAGHIAENIVETAAAEEADLIVMGSRGLSDVQGLFLGSVAHRVLQLARIAVLVTRAPIPVKAEEPALAAVAAAGVLT